MRPTSESAEWIFLATNLGLEILSAACDQASSPRRPHFALFGMLLAIAAVFISIGELINRGKREGVVLRRRGMLWWFYHQSPPPYTPFGTLPDIYGVVAGISQCICSIAQYVYCLRHADSPFKASLLPAIFLICLVGSRLSNNRMNASTEETLLRPNPENNAPANTPSPDNQEEQERLQRLQRLQEQVREQVREQEQERLQEQEQEWLQRLQEQEQEQERWKWVFEILVAR
ncbi:mediator of RNA polymerase II transcription subunit 15-like [Prunus dulcis]|uniref:mediator of RNA polymerase II transcription subunit 15-like n=1 Tax=Prunus dulcis TaxID=3755 RepID=UPI001483CB9C|nr:mediator of RNA polymerase II transcription subunit 15-like [Prunus dulcis]